MWAVLFRYEVLVFSPVLLRTKAYASIILIVMEPDNIQIFSKLERWLYIRRASFRRFLRILFPSPAELRFIELMGGRILKLPIKNRKGFNLVYILSMGKTLREEKFKREVRCGAFFIDFGNDVRRGIEIDGRKFHMDVVYEFERDIYLKDRDWRVIHIQAGDLWRQPDLIQRRVLSHIYY